MDEPCDRCGSTTFHDEDGRVYCDQGHDQGRTVTAEDDADFGRQGNIVRKKVDKVKVRTSKVLHGAKAYQLFLQSWQFILWKQCHILVHQKGLPAELWTIVRDLWTLWLSRLEHRLLDINTADEAGDATASSGNDSDPDLITYTPNHEHNKNRSLHLSPKLIDTAALIFMGILMLRRPIRQATMLRWLLEEDIPFIRAIRYVPQDMKDRLPGEYHASLDTTTRLPDPDDLQKAIFHRVKWFSSSFGMSMPSINHSLLLLDYVRHLALPLEVYTTARRLNAITKYDFAYPDVTKPLEVTRRHAATYPESQLMSLVVVATKLLFPFNSNKIKRYPKDPNDAATLRMNWTAWLQARLDFDKANDADPNRNRLKPGSEIHVTDHDIMNMTGQQMDQYMDWYQLMWMKNNGAAQDPQPQESGGIDKEILDMFPLAAVQEQTKTRHENEQDRADFEALLNNRIKKVQSSLRSLRAVSEEEEMERDLDLLRPGAMYPRFAKVADLDRGRENLDANTENVVKVFHQEAAQTACLSSKALILAVNRTEETIQRWLVAGRREEIFGEEVGSEADRGVDNIQEDVVEDPGDFVAESSPPAKLARELDGLGLGLSPNIQDQDQDQDEDGDVDMQILPREP